MDYSRGPQKTWVYGALRVRDGKELTRCAASRNSTSYIALPLAAKARVGTASFSCAGRGTRTSWKLGARRIPKGRPEGK